MNERNVARGFWLLLGLSAGLILSDILSSQRVEALATSSADNYLISTGASNQPTIDVVWLLDYRNAELLSFTLNPQGRLQNLSKIDLKKAFQIESGNPKFMMVTGRLVGAQNSDVLYLAEITTSQIVGYLAPNITGAARQNPQIIEFFRFNFRRASVDG